MCRAVENRLPPGRNAHDKPFVDAAQPVAGRCLLQCIHARRRCPAARRTAGRRRSACGRARASAGIAVDRTSRGSEAAAKLAPVAPPPIAAAPDKLPTAKLKVPAGFNIEVYAAGMANARSLARRRQGHGVRRQPPGRQGLCHRQQGRQTRGQGAGLRPLPAERPRLQGRHALHRRTVEDLQDREGRGQSGQPAEADRDLRQAAEGRGPWLEVHRHRSRQQALRSGRPARQQRAPRRRARPDPPDESRRLGRRSDRQGRSQHRRVRLASGDQAALLHRQRPRLDVGRRAARTS